jgi:hypothetical protein
MIRLFGTTIRETLEAFEGAHLGGRKKTTTAEPDDRTKALARIIISLVLVSVGAFLVAFGAASNERTAAISSGSAILSAVAGYWLK